MSQTTKGNLQGRICDKGWRLMDMGVRWETWEGRRGGWVWRTLGLNTPATRRGINAFAKRKDKALFFAGQLKPLQFLAFIRLLLFYALEEIVGVSKILIFLVGKFIFKINSNFRNISRLTFTEKVSNPDNNFSDKLFLCNTEKYF